MAHEYEHVKVGEYIKRSEARRIALHYGGDVCAQKISELQAQKGGWVAKTNRDDAGGEVRYYCTKCGRFVRTATPFCGWCGSPMCMEGVFKV